MKKLSLSVFLVLVFVSGCGKKPMNPLIEEVVDVSATLRLFESYNGMSTEGVDVGIAVKDFEWDGASAMSLCNENSEFNKAILLRRRFWDVMSTPTSRESIVLHELGHCIVRRGHAKGKYQGCPASLMNVPLMRDSCYKMFANYYLQELFQ